MSPLHTTAGDLSLSTERNFASALSVDTTDISSAKIESTTDSNEELNTIDDDIGRSKFIQDTESDHDVNTGGVGGAGGGTEVRYKESEAFSQFAFSPTATWQSLPTHASGGNIIAGLDSNTGN